MEKENISTFNHREREKNVLLSFKCIVKVTLHPTLLLEKKRFDIF